MKNKNLIKSLCFLIIISFLTLTSLSPVFNAETSINNDEFVLLIISPNNFYDLVEPLVEHKSNVGIKTIHANLDDVLNHPETNQGRDDAEKVKYYIKYIIEEYSINYVLLMGGKKGQLSSWYMPVRYVQMDNNWEPHYLTDLYFADIYNTDGSFSTWDSDNDAVFGEWYNSDNPEDVNIDLYPDITIGRLPCRNSKDVEIVVDKIINYETSTYNQPWFNEMVAVAGDTYPVSDNPLWVGNEGEYYADLAIDYMSDYNPTRLYLSKNGFSSPEDVINIINNGCGFLYFVGHGNPRSWGTHPPDSHEFVDGLQNEDMANLKNDDQLPLCIVSGCHNLQFDVSLMNSLYGFLEDGLQFFSSSGKFWRSEWAPKSWGWKMTSKANGGSIATFGATALGHTKEDKSSFTGGINELEVEMFRQHGLLDVEHVGDMLSNAVTWYLDTYPLNWDSSDETVLRDTWVDVQVVQSYILFGDPTLKIGGYE